VINSISHPNKFTFSHSKSTIQLVSIHCTHFKAQNSEILTKKFYKISFETFVAPTPERASRAWGVVTWSHLPKTSRQIFQRKSSLPLCTFLFVCFICLLFVDCLFICLFVLFCLFLFVCLFIYLFVSNTVHSWHTLGFLWCVVREDLRSNPIGGMPTCHVASKAMYTSRRSKRFW